MKDRSFSDQFTLEPDIKYFNISRSGTIHREISSHT